MIASQLNKIPDLEYLKLKNKMLISANIDRLLKKNGVTKKDLAFALGKSPSEVTRWLSGTLNIQIDTQTEIAYFFKVHVHELSMPIKDKKFINMYFINTKAAMPISVVGDEWEGISQEFVIHNQLPTCYYGGKS